MRDRRKSNLILIASILVTGCQSPNKRADQEQTPESVSQVTDPLPLRHIYGIGLIWADWTWPGDRSKWDWDARCMDRARAMGTTAVPINIPWHNVEPREGEWYFDYVDHQVAEAEKRGLAMFAYMGLTPDWALPADLVAKYGTGCGYRFPPPDDREQQFVDYCHRVSARYRGRIAHYQFWNEPNGCSWVNDGCANGHKADNTFPLYVRWLKTWYRSMKEEDPGALLAVGGLDTHEGVNAEPYINGLYAEGAKDSFDALAIHPYGITEPLYWEAIHTAREIMVAHGDGHKPIWLREYGWSTEDEAEKSAKLRAVLTRLQSTKYDYVTMAMYLGLTDVTRRDDHFGLLNDDLTPRPSYETFQSIARYQQ